MVRNTILFIALIIGLRSYAQEGPVVVRFTTGSTALDAAAVKELEAMCARAEGRSLTIIGHSDDQGSQELNKRLSRERAEQVRELLHRTCPRTAVRSVTGEGGTRPVANNSTDAGRSLNRRVEVMITPDHVPISDRFEPLTDHGHARVTPLLPGADKPRELHRVDASKAIEAHMSDGTIVRIQAGAIVNTNGEPVQGAVDLTYRSFLDPWDVVASGIPMHLGMNADARHFETAGMYEVYASQNGEPVRIREGCEITLETKGPTVDDRYAAYTLNETTGQWENGGRFVDAAPMTNEPPSAAAREYTSILQKQRPLPDSLAFLDRQASPYYCYTRPCLATKKAYAYRKGKYGSPYGAEIPAIRVDMDRQYWKDHHRIAFVVNSAYRNHPEWRPFGAKRWIYHGDLDRLAFRKTISRKHFYQDVELIAANGSQGVIRVKDRGTWMELPVEMADPAEDTNDPKNLDFAVSAYEKRLSQKAREFDRELMNELKRTHSQRKRIAGQAYAKAARRMNAEERAMDASTFHDHALTSMTTFNIYQQKRDNTYSFARRPRFAMPGFGIWNCDRMIPMPVVESPVEVIAQDGEPIIWRTAYGVPENGRAVVTYWNVDGRALQSMRLSTSCERIIFVDDQQRMTVAEVPEGKRGKKGKLVVQGLPLSQPKDRKVLELLARRSE